MSDEPPVSPDDLRWKALVRRQGAGHQASAALRARVEQVLRDAPEEAPLRGSFRLRATAGLRRQLTGPWRIARLAAAAMVLLAVGGGTYVAYHEWHERAEREEYVEANRPLLALMASTHEAEAAGADAVSVTQGYAKVAEELSTRAGHRVVAPDWTGEGWRLASASVVSMNGTPAAHLRYVADDGAKISVYSLPLAAFRADAGDEYDTEIGGTAISGYTTADSVRCVVGDGSRRAGLAALRDRLKQL